MQREAAGVERAAYSIGVGFGLTAGLVGVAQWVLTARDLAQREAALDAIAHRCGCLVDGTNVARGNEWFWIYSALLAGVAMLGLYLLAAFTAAWTRRRHDGLVAAWVAAVVSGAIYVVATILAIWSSPEPPITKSVVPCALPLGLVVFGLMLLLTQVVTTLGISASAYLSRRRRAVWNHL